MASLGALSQAIEVQVYLYANNMLARIAQDYNLDHMELMNKYLEKPGSAKNISLKDGSEAPAQVLVMATEQKAKRLRKPKEGKVLCKGVTAKGQPCKFGACDGSEYCKKHGEGVEKKSKNTKKSDKVPEHNHNPGEVPEELCGLCDSHGDVTNNMATVEEFITEDEMREEITNKLKNLGNLLEEEEEEKEEEEEDEEEEDEEDEKRVELLANILANEDADEEEEDED